MIDESLLHAILPAAGPKRKTLTGVLGLGYAGRMLVKVESYFDGESWCARGIGEDIFTQGRTLDELHRNIEEAVAAHFGDTTEPIHVVIVTELTVAHAKTPGD